MLLEDKTSCPDVEIPPPITLDNGGDTMYANPCQALITLFNVVLTPSLSPM